MHKFPVFDSKDEAYNKMKLFIQKIAELEDTIFGENRPITYYGFLWDIRLRENLDKIYTLIISNNPNSYEDYERFVSDALLKDPISTRIIINVLANYMSSLISAVALKEAESAGIVPIESGSSKSETPNNVFNFQNFKKDEVN